MSPHWREIDFRINSLNQIINGLERSVLDLNKKNEEIPWYDGIHLLEDLEPIYGLAFIAYQNYVNSSIYDFDLKKKKEEFYRLDQKIANSEKTRIELIIGIANYFKHRDSGQALYRGTSELLDSFNFQYGESFDIAESPIFKGLDILHPEWDLEHVTDLVKEWRDSLWKRKAKSL